MTQKLNWTPNDVANTDSHDRGREMMQKWADYLDGLKF